MRKSVEFGLPVLNGIAIGAFLGDWFGNAPTATASAIVLVGCLLSTVLFVRQ